MYIGIFWLLCSHDRMLSMAFKFNWIQQTAIIYMEIQFRRLSDIPFVSFSCCCWFFFIVLVRLIPLQLLACGSGGDGQWHRASKPYTAKHNLRWSLFVPNGTRNSKWNTESFLSAFFFSINALCKVLWPLFNTYSSSSSSSPSSSSKVASILWCICIQYTWSWSPWVWSCSLLMVESYGRNGRSPITFPHQYQFIKSQSDVGHERVIFSVLALLLLLLGDRAILSDRDNQTTNTIYGWLFQLSYHFVIHAKVWSV